MIRRLAALRPFISPTSLLFTGVALGGVLLVASPDVRGMGPRAEGRELTSPLDAIEVAPVAPAAARPTFATKPGALVMPENANCAGCHQDSHGVIAHVNPPALAHPLTGWTNCTACHSDTALVKTAPGHEGIAVTDCLICHTADTAPAPPRPEHVNATDNCLACHGKTTTFPAAMATRSVTVCWLCHRAPTHEGGLGSDLVP